MKVLCIALMFVTFSCPVIADARCPITGKGIYLCGTPRTAIQFWNDLHAVGARGGPITDQTTKDLGDKYHCTLNVGRELRPQDFYDGVFWFDIEKGGGYAEPHMYLRYMAGTRT